MKLIDLLSNKKTVVLNRWYDSILNTYPPETATFLKNQKNPFLNPVGSTIWQAIEQIYEDLLHGTEKAAQFLDNIIRIRAVQDLTPAQCLGFISLLKTTIREELKQELADKQVCDELMAFELKIDSMTLLAFDIYMKCREKIFDIKVRELQSWTFRRLQKADEVCKKEYPFEDINNQTIEFERKEVAK